MDWNTFSLQFETQNQHIRIMTQKINNKYDAYFNIEYSILSIFNDLEIEWRD
jgi:hypothetical protein